jgi:succinate dehydrogenase / fumarate reductase, cytochrome b subunit
VTTLLRYRGREGMLAWAFHRISGIGIFAFIVLHVIDIYLVGGNPELYDEVLAFYASVPGRLLEVVLGAALLYHALNGLRIIIIDLWPAMTVYHRLLWWGDVGHLHRPRRARRADHPAPGLARVLRHWGV